MREYKVVKASEKDAEAVMNEMARQGWRVVCTTYWSYWWVHLLITFERERVMPARSARTSKTTRRMHNEKEQQIYQDL